MSLFHDVIYKNAKRFPEKTALIIDRKAISYRELRTLANRTATTLMRLGVKSGDSVGLYASISIELVACFLALLQIGAITAATHHTLSREKLIQQLKDAKARILITDSTTNLEPLAFEAGLDLTFLLKPYQSRSELIVNLQAALDEQVGINDHECARDRITDDRPTSIFYTTGSTFNPKGVLVNHQIMLAASEAVTRYLEIQPSDRVFSYSTLASDYGVYNILMPLYVGATSIIESQAPTTADDVLQIVESYHVTAMHVFPPVFFLIAGADSHWRSRVNHLRYISSSGQALYPKHIRKIRALFPELKIFSNYGLTECKRVSFLDPAEIDARPDSVGKPLEEVAAFLVDDHDDLISEAGVVGELLVGSEYLMLGYWERPDDNRKSILDNTFGQRRLYRTGDLFRRDAEGFLYYVARKDDVFTRNVWNVNPREIEQCLISHPAVSEAVVKPIADESAGHVPKAFVVLEKNSGYLTGQDLIEYCKRHIDWHMVPTECVLVSSLPRSDSGKSTTKGLA